ncbi:MAG: tetratricopeptide repeat protein [Prolixibacteraceae bacterium]|jgi:tetratricopeptide (TPR) repeat protein|nr:tetratricopeptide repeat protein [Prolixibacteraceae bacterium]
MTLFKYYFILLLLVVLMACGTQKQATDNQNLNEKTENSKPVELSEEKRIEFEYLFIEGLKQKMLGNQEMAIQYFNGCLDINPQSATSLYELSGIYVLKGEIVSAKLLLEKAIQIDPSNKWYKLLLAQIYQGNNEYSKAGEIYAGLLQAEPDNVDYLYQSAMLSASSDQPKKALNAYNELERVVGYNEQIALARQQLYREMGENKKAYAEIQKLIDTFPDVPEYHGVMADMYKEDGKMEEALKHYHKVLEMDPSNGFVHFSLATFYLQDNKIDEGYSHARKGFSNPDVAIKTKIQLYLMLVNAPDAISLDDSDIEELVALIVEAHPDDARSYSIMADYLIQQKRSEEARDYMLKALDVSSDNYQLWEQLLMIDNELLDFESMAKHSEKAISLFPSQPLLYVLNAVANLQLKEYQKVLKSLESGQLYVADNKRMAGQFEMYRAEAYYNLGEKEKAFSSFDKAIGINSENYMALNNYAYYLSELGVELEKAEVMSGRVVQVHPDNPTYLDTHAWVLFKKGEYRLAKFYMDTAMQNGGDESDVVIEHYGDIHYKLGDVENALKYWRQSLEMGNSSKLLKKKIEEKRYIEGEE